MERAGRGRKEKRPKRPKVVDLTHKLLAARGEGQKDEVLDQLIAKEEADETLKRLVEDQKADFEPSPLDPDPVDGPPRRVKSRKFL
jgi:hypothetical protein